jgi:hypothetical protein
MIFGLVSIEGSWGVRRLMLLFRFCGTCFLSGLLALPLSGAGLTFFAAAKKVSKESSFFRQQSPHVQRTSNTEWPSA